MELSVQVETVFGLTWPTWKAYCSDVESLGFAGLFRCDHFNWPPENEPALELIVSLTYLAGNSDRVHFGALVAPVSFRDPVMMARQISQIDDLSGGRAILAVGAGWHTTEHEMFGYPLGDVPTRAARFEEALEVMTLLLRSPEPVNFEGQFYHLRNAVMEPHPQREGGPPILIGGNGPRRTLPLVAKYAGIWNAVGLQPDAFEERSKRLDGLLREAGRKPEDVQRTAMVPVLVWRDEGEIETRLGWARRMFPDIDAQRPSDLVAAVRGRMPEAVMGTPDEVLETLRAFERAGCQEIMIQWFNLPDREGIRAVAQDVMPRLDDGE